MPNKFVAFFLTSAFALVSYYGCARLGLYFATLNETASPVWPASGLALAGAIAFGGPAWYLGIFLGALAANLPVNPLASAMFIAFGNTLEACFGLWIYHRILRERRNLSHSTKPIAFVSSAVFATMISASVGTLVLAVTDKIGARGAFDIWITWWIGDLIGALLVAPFLLSCFERFRSRRHGYTNWTQVFAVLSITVGTSVLIFSTKPGAPWLFLIFPCLLLGAHYLPHLGMRAVTFLIGAISIGFSIRHQGPFNGAGVNSNLIHLQLFLASVGITALFLEGFRASGPLRLPARVLLSGWLLSGLLFYGFHVYEETNEAKRFQELAARASNQILTRLNTYEELLVSGASYISTSGTVTPSNWASYVKSQNIRTRYPGIAGLGVIWPVKHKDLDAFHRRYYRLDPHFKLTYLSPDGMAPKTQDHFIISLLEPKEGNLPAIGLDIGSHSGRRQAAELARESGRAALTSQIQLVQDSNKSVGFLIFFPIFDTTDRHEFRGWVYAPFLAEKFFGTLMTELGDQLELQIFEESPTSPKQAIFSSSKESTREDFEKVMSLTLAQRPFTLGWRRSAQYRPSSEGNLAWVGFTAALVALLLAGLVASLQSVNVKASALAMKQTRALQEIRERYELAVKGSHDGIWDWDIQAETVYYSPRWKEIFGYQDHEVDNSYSTWRNLIHPGDSSRNANKIAAYFRGELEYYSFEGRFRHKDGHYLWCLVRGEALRNPQGQPYRMAGSLTDITVRKNAEFQTIAAREAAESATLAKSEFLANISHEIRTPLTGLMGTANLLKSTSLNPLQVNYLEVIQSSADSLLVMLNDVLDFSKIEANKVVLEDIEYDLKAMVAEVVKILGPSAEHKGLALKVNYPPDLDRLVFGDSARVRQILLNLVSNAIKFTPRGRIDLNIKILSKAEEKLNIRFEVADSGIGISPEALEGIFDAFSQADTSTTRRFGGTGLGLSICKKLAKLMGSDLQARSQLNLGSTFWFDLEVRLGGPIPTLPIEDGSLPEVTRGARIMVAEDNYINQRVLVTILQEAGYTAHGVSNGFEALESMHKQELDLVLMDCQMPGLDGYEASTKWRSEAPSAKAKLPIVALTAHAVKGDREKAIAAGMNDYLTKPVRTDLLIRTIERWLAEDLKNIDRPKIKVNEQAMKDLADPAKLGSAELLREILSLFLSESPRQVSQIHEAFQSSDWLTVRKTAHKLKAGCATLGYDGLKNFCGELEEWALAPLDPERMEGRLSCFIEQFGMVENEIRARYNALK